MKNKNNILSDENIKLKIDLAKGNIFFKQK